MQFKSYSSDKVIALDKRWPQGRRKIERIDYASLAVLRRMLRDVFSITRYCGRPIICALRARNGGIGLSARLTIQEISVSRQELIPLITCSTRAVSVPATATPITPTPLQDPSSISDFNY